MSTEKVNKFWVNMINKISLQDSFLRNILPPPPRLTKHETFVLNIKYFLRNIKRKIKLIWLVLFNENRIYDE